MSSLNNVMPVAFISVQSSQDYSQVFLTHSAEQALTGTGDHLSLCKRNATGPGTARPVHRLAAASSLGATEIPNPSQTPSGYIYIMVA